MSKEMTADYQRAVGDFVNRNVLCCVSSLVCDVMTLVQNADADTLRNTSFDFDDLQGLMERKGWEAPGREKIDDMDRDDLVTALDDAGVEDDRTDLDDAASVAFEAALLEGLVHPDAGDTPRDFHGQWPLISDEQLREKLIAAIDEQADGWKDFCEEHSLDCEYDDVYEHWAVDSWFGARLKERGEVVGDFGNLTVWGRCATGQSISLDDVVRQIYNELHSDRAVEAP